MLERLGDEDALVHDGLQSVEHSVEAMVPFLQHASRERHIVSILVPYMSWERLAELSGRAAEALVASAADLGLSMSEDVAILVSSDAVHYGDEEWGGRTFADFGVDQAGYDQAVERDLGLIENHLAGELATARLEALFRQLVADDVHEYRITWCGRFSVPFGLAMAARAAELSGRGPLRGELLRYATTLDPGRSDPGVEGLGVTAPANLRHWVGFAAIGYR
jgi:AmmeMemoRadiSam system protein B